MLIVFGKNVSSVKYYIIICTFFKVNGYFWTVISKLNCYVQENLLSTLPLIICDPPFDKHHTRGHEGLKLPSYDVQTAYDSLY